MRAFLALYFNEDTEKFLKDLQVKFEEKTKDNFYNVKFNLVDDFHITLKFYDSLTDVGAVKETLENKRKQIIKLLDSVIDLEKFHFFSRFDKQVGSKVPSVFILKTISQKLDNLQKDLFNDVRFDQHITFSRMKYNRFDIKVQKYIEHLTFFMNENIDIENDRLVPNRLALMKSTLTPSGPKYEELDSIRF